MTHFSFRNYLFLVSYSLLVQAFPVFGGPVYKARLLEFEATAMNNHGVVTGLLSNQPLPLQGVIWEDGKMTTFSSIWDDDVFAWDISDSGLVVGEAHAGQPTSLAFMYQAGRFSPLGTLTTQSCEATGVNSQGQVIGFFSFPRVSFIWENGELTPLPGLISGTESHTYPFAINNRGQVAGVSNSDEGFNNFGVLWENGEVHNLSLGFGLNSSARDINDHGEIAGEADYPDGHSTATLWLWDEGRSIDLGTLPGTTGSFATDLNNRRQVVGVVAFCCGKGNWEAFYWEDGEMRLLADLMDEPGWFFYVPKGINDAGQIIVGGIDPRGVVGSFLLDRVNPLNPADFDEDGTVNGIDLGIMLANWNEPGLPDLNHDGAVDGIDLGILLANWTL